MKNSYSHKLFLSLITLGATIFCSSQIKADTLQVSSNITPEQMVQEILIGGGVVTSNITYTGNNISRGKFWGGPGNIGISDGIILTSGNVTIAPGPNNNTGAGANSGQGGDPDLNMIAGVSTFDACLLEFDFIPQSTTVTFRYVFASEEYHEYVDQFNDAFGFFISGPGITGIYSNNSANIALIPLTNIPVTINTVNCGNPYNCRDYCDHCQYFVNNTQQFTQYDAFTKTLTAWATVIPCETYHIKLAIGDGLDHAYDSGVFLEANSFSSIGIASEMEFTQPNVEFLIEGCSDVSILFTLSNQPDADFYLPITISGSAINGIDYLEIPDSIFYPQGYTQAWLDIITIPDQISEWFENIRIVYNSSLCDVDYDTILISLKDYQLGLQMTPDTIINCATNASIGVENIFGFEPYSFLWSTGDTTAYITVSPLITTTYYVTVSALCDSTTTDSVKVIVNGPESNAGVDLSIPYGTTTTLQGSAGQGSGDYTFSWEPAEMLDDPTSPTPTTVQMIQTVPFTLTVTDLAGGCQDIDQMVLFVFGGPLNAGPVADPVEICSGGSSQLFSYASGGSENYTYTWTSIPPGFSSNLQDPIVQPVVNTTYHVVINDGYNSVSGDVTVEVYNVGVLSEIEYTEDPYVDFTIEGCSNASVMLTLSNQADEDFYLPLIISGSAANGIDYEEIPNSVFFQQGQSQAWFDIITIPDQIAENVENIRIVYDSSVYCVNYDTILIDLRDYTLALETTPDTMAYCGTEAYIGVKNIYGFEPYSLVWSTGDITEYITVSPLITTTYYVTVSALCDSMTTDSIIVYVNSPESHAGQDLSIPYGTTTNLQGSASQGSGTYTYSWEPDSLLVDPTSPTPLTVQMVQTTQFTLTITDLAGSCQDVDQMILSVTGGPLNVGPIADPVEICPGESAHLIPYAGGGSGDYTYSWSSIPPGFSSELLDPYVQPLVTTTYYVMINDGFNTVTGDVTVVVSILPVPEAGENDTIWNGTIGHLYGSASLGSGSYTWHWEPFNKLLNPYAPNPVTVELIETTLFWLSVTDNNTGCVCAGADYATVVVNGGPLAVSAEVSDSLICLGETTQLHALPSGGNQDNYTYTWSSIPAGFSSDEREPFISPVDDTKYTVQIFDQFNYSQAEVSIIISQPPVVSLGADTLVCPYDTVLLTANNPGMTFYWSNGSVEPSISIGTTGIGFDIKKIWVQVENAYGCVSTDTIRVIFDFAECSGVGENEDDIYFYLYPNPTTGKVLFEWKRLSGEVEMQISDIHGNMILDQTIHSPLSGDYKGSFNLDGQSRGIFLLRLISEDKVLVRKIVLQ